MAPAAGTQAAETPEALLQRARVLVVQGHLDEGERVFAKAIKKAPSAFEAFEIQGELELGRGNVFGALDAYKAARERSPKGAPGSGTNSDGRTWRTDRVRRGE